MYIELQTPIRIDKEFNLEIEFDIELNIAVFKNNKSYDLIYYGHRYSRDGNITLDNNKAFIDLNKIDADKIYVIATSYKHRHLNAINKIVYSITDGDSTKIYEIESDKSLKNKSSIVLFMFEHGHIYTNSHKSFETSDIRYIVSHLL
jgi:stress response protein SCP2